MRDHFARGNLSQDGFRAIFQFQGPILLQEEGCQRRANNSANYDFFPPNVFLPNFSANSRRSETRLIRLTFETRHESNFVCPTNVLS